MKKVKRKINGTIILSILIISCFFLNINFVNAEVPILAIIVAGSPSTYICPGDSITCSSLNDLSDLYKIKYDEDTIYICSGESITCSFLNGLYMIEKYDEDTSYLCPGDSITCSFLNDLYRIEKYDEDTIYICPGDSITCSFLNDLYRIEKKSKSSGSSYDIPTTLDCPTHSSYDIASDSCRCNNGYEVNVSKTACIKTKIEIIQHPSGTLIRAVNSNGVYLIERETRMPIKSAEIFLGRGYKWRDVIIVSQEEINSYPIGPEVSLLDIPPENEQFPSITIADGALIRAKGTTGIYLTEGSKRKPIKSAEIFLAKGYKWADVIEVKQSVVLAYELGLEVTIGEDNKSPNKQQSIGTLFNGTLARKKGSPGVYLIYNNQKRPIKSAEIFSGRGYKWGDVIDVEQSVLDIYSLGDDITLLENIVIENEIHTITINVPTLRVRSLPSINGGIIAKVSEGQNYNVIEENNGWYKIRYKALDNIQMGWVMGIYTK